MTSSDDDVLNSAEAAAYLRVAVSTITDEAKRGRLPGRRVGKGWRFSRRVLEQWLASGPDAEDINRYRWKSKTEPRSDGKDEPP